MARLVVVVMAALCCVFSVMSISCFARDEFFVQGRVYCDNCRIGYETPSATKITGAKVKIECRNKQSQEVVFTEEGVTDASGIYKIIVTSDHEKELCESVLISSPQPGCNKIEIGRERSLVMLTHNNGMASDIRFANSLGFIADKPLPNCSESISPTTQSLRSTRS